MKKNVFVGKKSDLMKMLFQYCSMVDKGQIQDKAEVLIRMENAKNSSSYLGVDTLQEIN